MPRGGQVLNLLSVSRDALGGVESGDRYESLEAEENGAIGPNVGADATGIRIGMSFR